MVLKAAIKVRSRSMANFITGEWATQLLAGPVWRRSSLHIAATTPAAGVSGPLTYVIPDIPDLAELQVSERNARDYDSVEPLLTPPPATEVVTRAKIDAAVDRHARVTINGAGDTLYDHLLSLLIEIDRIEKTSPYSLLKEEDGSWEWWARPIVMDRR